VAEVSARGPIADAKADAKPQAEQLAALIGKSVQAGIALSGSMDLRDAGDGDAIRAALSAIAAPLVAARYRVAGQIPGDAEVKEIVTGLEAVLTFADSFSGVPAAAERLKNLTAVPADENQATLNCMRAMVPVVGEIAAFSFGRPEKKLAQEIAARLLGEAASLIKTAMPDADDAARKAAELELLGPLAEIYASCHREQTKRILAMDEKARQEAALPGGGLLPMEPVWQAFEIRAVMLAALGQGAAQSASSAGPAPETEAAPHNKLADIRPIETGSAPAQSSGGSPFASFVKTPAAETPPAAPEAAPPPAAPPPVAPQAPETPASSPSSSENPMSFFAGGGKKSSDETGTSG
jgi:hypothetical protein